MKFIVNGGKPLSGEIEVRGSKNAATPILAATLLTERPCVIKNLPLIGDVLAIIELLESVGSRVKWLDERTVRVVNKDINPRKLNAELVCKMRSSVLFMGPLLARFGEIIMNTPGGCYIGARPLDAHLDAFRELGFSVAYDKTDDLYHIVKKRENSRKSITLKEFSVTATENVLMFGAIHAPLGVNIAALEPHIEDLSHFLEKLGAEFEGLGTHSPKITRGIERDGGEIEYAIMNDPIEAGTFLALGAATKSDIRVVGAPREAITLPLFKLEEFGVMLKVNNSFIEVLGAKSKLRAVRKLMTQPYPGFPSDLQAPFGVLATQAKGETLIFDTLYEGRLKYLYELEKMGAEVEILGPHRAIVKGQTPLRGKNVESIDLRAGATLVIAALVAEGESTLHTAEQIDRGYEKLEGRLRVLGADIKRQE